MIQGCMTHAGNLFIPTFCQNELQKEVEDEYRPNRHRDDHPVPEAANDLPDRSQAVAGSGSPR